MSLLKMSHMGGAHLFVLVMSAAVLSLGPACSCDAPVGDADGGTQDDSSAETEDTSIDDAGEQDESASSDAGESTDEETSQSGGETESISDQTADVDDAGEQDGGDEESVEETDAGDSETDETASESTDGGEESVDAEDAGSDSEDSGLPDQEDAGEQWAPDAGEDNDVVDSDAGESTSDSGTEDDNDVDAGGQASSEDAGEHEGDDDAGENAVSIDGGNAGSAGADSGHADDDDAGDGDVETAPDAGADGGEFLDAGGDEDGGSDDGTSIADDAQPAQPGLLLRGRLATLSWDPVDQAEYYTVAWAIDELDYETGTTQETSLTTTDIDESLENGLYIFGVRTHFGDGSHLDSEVITGRIFGIAGEVNCNGAGDAYVMPVSEGDEARALLIANSPAHDGEFVVGMGSAAGIFYDEQKADVTDVLGQACYWDEPDTCPRASFVVDNDGYVVASPQATFCIGNTGPMPYELFLYRNDEAYFAIPVVDNGKIATAAEGTIPHDGFQQADKIVEDIPCGRGWNAVDIWQVDVEPGAELLIRTLVPNHAANFRPVIIATAHLDNLGTGEQIEAIAAGGYIDDPGCVQASGEFWYSVNCADLALQAPEGELYLWIGNLDMTTCTAEYGEYAMWVYAEGEAVPIDLVHDDEPQVSAAHYPGGLTVEMPCGESRHFEYAVEADKSVTVLVDTIDDQSSADLSLEASFTESSDQLVVAQSSIACSAPQPDSEFCPEAYLQSTQSGVLSVDVSTGDAGCAGGSAGFRLFVYDGDGELSAIDDDN